MIDFDLMSAAPRPLAALDWRVLGQVLARTVKKSPDGRVAIKFVSREQIRKLNQQYRKINRPTDVLSFTPADFPEVESENFLGDVVICPTYAAGEAKRQGIGEREELVRLLVHGVLHLLGYDHGTPVAEARMFKLQEQAVAKFI